MCTVAFGLHQGYGHKIDGATHAWPYIVWLRPNICTGLLSAVLHSVEQGCTRASFDTTTLHTDPRKRVKIATKCIRLESLLCTLACISGLLVTGKCSVRISAALNGFSLGSSAHQGKFWDCTQIRPGLQ